MDTNPAKINRTRQLDQDEQLNLQTHSEFHELEESACSSGPLGKSAATNYFLLQRACIFAELSTRVYAEKGKVGEVQLLTAVPDPMADAVAAGNAQTAATQPKATLLSLSTSAPVHAIYLVEDLGVVVAFRGTKELEDVLTDASLGPVSITQYDISLHGSIYNAAATSISRIVAGYKEAVSQQNPSARAEVLPLYLTGHSLGGGIAECAFLELLAAHDHEQLVLPVCAGGVYTFGAPLIVHGSDGMQAIKSMYENARKGDGPGVQMPVFNFVNGLDVVPRLLGQTVIPQLLKVLANNCTRILARSLLDLAITTIGNFVPFGTFCLMLGDTVKLVDTCNPSNSTALQMTAQQLLEGMVVIGRKKKGDYPVRSRLTSDHSIVRYQDGLQAALCSMVPLLFLGGHVSDYQPELVQYYVDQGLVQEVALKHKKTGIPSLNSFAQMPVTKVLASMRMAYSGSKSVTQAVAGKRSKEFWNLFRSAVVGMARSGMQKDVADGKSSELVAKAVDHGGCWPGGSLAPGPARNGKVAADMVASGVPALQFANLAVNILSLGVTCYNTSMLHKVRSQQQETQSHVEQIGRDVKHLQGDVRQGQEAHAEGLATLHRCQQQGMALLETLSPELQSAMGQHAHAQGERFDQLGVQLKSSQDILMQGQSELMQELQQVQASIQEHSMAAIKESQQQNLRKLHQELREVICFYDELQRLQQTAGGSSVCKLAEELRTAAIKLFSHAENWLADPSWMSMHNTDNMSPADIVALRQPFVLTLSIAAIAADTGSNVSVQDCAQIGKYGPHHHRSRAKQQVDIHINKLLQSSTLWSLATKHADAMAGYVYLRRALDGRARIGQVLRPYCEPCSSLTCAVTYDAADLIWLDGLDELRGLLADASVAAPFDKTVAPAWRCGCLAEMDWYYKWKQWSEDKELDGKMMPLVRTYDLLTDIGMSCDEAKAARVPVAKLPTLCSMVLPDFQAAIVQSLADQLPGIGSNVEPNQKAWLTGVKPCSAPDSMLT